MDIKKVGVIGAGAMGLGIAQVCAQAGLSVVLNDLNLELVEKALKRIDKIWAKLWKGQTGSEAKTAIIAKINKSSELKDVADCDVVIEAIVEYGMKSLFKQLTNRAAILASNLLTIGLRTG